ncbi:zinc finger protein 37-like isoform X3 [Ruditapes philippinarum]|uniref:zinc finger protein 37-like isoform X3 n=2 Tax=Ruditapes philippinarum TaxID=129788 RepID=UPI00295AD31F|nr:zinc finger protein 37-like isoform X3 [Ruditapes philippinarum]
MNKETLQNTIMELDQVKHRINENAEPANNKQDDVNACCDSDSIMELDQVKHGINENAEPANNKQDDVNACCDSEDETFSQNNTLHLTQSLPSTEFVKIEIEEIIEEEEEAEEENDDVDDDNDNRVEGKEKEKEGDNEVQITPEQRPKRKRSIKSIDKNKKSIKSIGKNKKTIKSIDKNKKSIKSIDKNQKQKQTRCRLTLTKLAWDRWNDLKTSLSVKTHNDLALLLIDCWYGRHGNSGLEQNTHVDAGDADESMKFKSEEVKVEINDEVSNDLTDVDYDELSNSIKARGKQDNKTGTENTEQMEPDDLVAKLISDYHKGNLHSNKSGTKRKMKKPKASNELDYDVSDIHDDDEEEPVPPIKKRKSTQKSEKESKEKKSKVTPKNGNQKKAKSPEPKKPWVKIQLSEHKDKYLVESLKSFAHMKRSNTAVETLFSCLVCNHFKCGSKDVFENHIEKHINKVFNCEGCQYIGNSEQDIRKHKWTCCKRPKRESVCSLCGHWTASSESRRHHLGKVHGIPSWKCMFCPDMFKTNDERKDHMRTVHEEACQYCESCKLCKHLLSKEDFKAHLENCSSSVQCQICGLLVKKRSMNMHIKSKHENIRKHQCHRCPYAAKTVRRLKTHLLCHDNIHPFKCNMCSFSCIQSHHLKSHMRTHTGEKPYKCTQCKFAAAWTAQLKDHIKVHSIATAVMCQECDVAFINERTLNLHTKKEHCFGNRYQF